LIGKANEAYTQRIADGGESLSREQKKLYKNSASRQKKRILNAALLVIFGVLVFLKYTNFLVNSLIPLLKLVSINVTIPHLDLLLPLGISFYTFQSGGYLIDVYRGRIKPDTNLAKYALFVSFFPQIIQGPISRYDQLAQQLYQGHAFDYTRVKFGLQLILFGIFKKLVIADRAAIIVNTVFDHYTQYQGFTVLFAAMLYCVQIYCDFSGGIDIARGVAEVLGIRLAPNFMQPFFATSVSDFWRRWHISLSSWMRDYIFYPLSISPSFARLGKAARKLVGNDLGKMVPGFLAMQITFFVVGAWHGAKWKYIVYGVYNGFFISSELLLEPYFRRLKKRFKLNSEAFSWRLFQIFGTFFIISIGRYFSRAASMTDAINMLQQTFSVFNPWVFLDGSIYKLGLNISDFNLLLVVIGLLLFIDLLHEKGFSIRLRLSEQNILFRWSIYMCAIFAVILFGIYGDQHQIVFIYRGF
jgi:D-alanyl-lipoteichoic acid acyltransferase DltB (MBOAT superfamily)